MAVTEKLIVAYLDLMDARRRADQSHAGQGEWLPTDADDDEERAFADFADTAFDCGDMDPSEAITAVRDALVDEAMRRHLSHQGGHR